MITIVKNLRHYRDVTRGIRQSLRAPWPRGEEKIVRDSDAVRAQNFLELMRTSVFQRPDSLYRSLFRMAGCSFEDLRDNVLRDGLDAALEQLLRSGIYISHSEFKSGQSIRRGSVEIPVRPHSLLNPLAAGWLPIASGGSSGRPIPASPNTLHLLERARYLALLCQEFSLQESLHIAVRPILPGAAGILDTLQLALLGCRIDRWFSPSGAEACSVHYRWLTRYLIALERHHSIGVPYPVYLEHDDFSPVVRWIEKRRREGFQISVGSFISHAVRVASRAMEMGCDIGGTLFLSGGEALSPAKRQTIERAGARLYPRYHISEAGTAGLPCRHMNDENRVHALDDRLTVVAGPLSLPDGGSIPQVLFFTSLTPGAPYLLLNVDLGDTGVIESCSCDCLFTAAGFCRQIRHIQSYAKLTTQGMTLESRDLAALLESSLPKKFGGIPGDYQLVETEGAYQTQLILRIHPRIPDIEESALLHFFSTQIRSLYGGALASRTWNASRGIVIERSIPQTTPSGKFSSVLLMREALHGPS